MVVCHCRAVSDRVICAEIEAGAGDVAEVGTRCGAGTGCGGCHPTVERLITQLAPPAGDPAAEPVG